MSKFLDLHIGDTVIDAEKLRFSEISKMRVLVVLDIDEGGKVTVADGADIDEFYLGSIHHGCMRSVEEYLTLLKEYEVFNRDVIGPCLARRHAS